MVQLYGGAISCDIDSGNAKLVDVSKFRQVPDTQEVFILEQEGGNAKYDQSIIFDLLEMVDEGEYEKAIKVHLEDLSPESENQFVEKTATRDGFDAFLSVVTSHNERRDSKEPDAPGGVVTFISLIRINRANTDVVVSINVPVANLDQDVGPSWPAYKLLKSISQSYQVHDWALFG